MAQTVESVTQADTRQAEAEQPALTAPAVLKALRQLSPRDRLWVIARALPEAERDLPAAGPRKSALGVLAHLGPAPSAEEIDEARREMWAGSENSGR
ncbi:MAG: hypothetical protein ACRDI2_12365 [Chloroflexota bacterium]